jgi:hypothetical protein
MGIGIFIEEGVVVIQIGSQVLSFGFAIGKEHDRQVIGFCQDA